MQVFQNAKWIWADGLSGADSYAEFYKEFLWQDAKQGEKTLMRISADSDYCLWINGQFVSCNQYADYEWYKAYDELDITPYLQAGKNAVAVLVWYFGENFQRYLVAPSGLLFEIERAGQVCVESDETVLSRKSRAYRSGAKKWMTPQLGFSYEYDANKEDNWKKGELNGFAPSLVKDKRCDMVARPIEKSQLLSLKTGKVVQNKDDKLFVLDLGEETVGLFSFAFTSATAQKITLSYGEDLKESRVRRLVGARDFSFSYIAKAGENEYANYMLRLGCRYLQIECEDEISLRFAGVIPQVYPVKVRAFEKGSAFDKAVYQMCVNSLRLCMMEHYADCPWREQCLYAYDSRNQMLCGYEAFEDGNFAYVRANLALMNKDRYPSGLMAICYPCGVDLTIPSFSLYYALSVKEYMEASKDYAFGKEAYARIKQILEAFLAQRREDGLVYRFAGKENWNFYDWSTGSDGAVDAGGMLQGEDEIIPDAQANILTVMALRAFEKICEMSGLDYPFANEADALKERVYQSFFDKTAGLMRAKLQDEGVYLELVNALAVCFGIVTGAEAEKICEALANGTLVPCSLSMKCFTYDAMLAVDEGKYREVILADIRKNYKAMVESGSTATWETAEGASAFENAGSLCHGWTALPIYYFRKLL